MMATFTDIKEVRLQINDPPGFIDFVQVADEGSRPLTPAAQTAYCIVNEVKYQAFIDGVWTDLMLRVSDSRISGWIDDVGVKGAIGRGYQAIIQKLGDELRIVRNSDGAEATEFVEIEKLLDYYRTIAKDSAAEPPLNNAGRYFATKKPCIAGGNV
jgi:hypothetical protein